MSDLAGINRIIENPPETISLICQTLLKIIQNILDNPNDSKPRRVALLSDEVANKLMPYSGGLEALFEMGFQEEEDSFFLPFEVNIEKLNFFKNQFNLLLKPKKSICIESPKVPNGALCITSRPSTRREFGLNNPKNQRFAQEIFASYEHVLMYENFNLRQKALACIPIDRLRNEARIKYNSYKNTDMGEVPYDFEDFLLLELLAWFKNEFFRWINQPDCDSCKSNQNMQFIKSDIPFRNEVTWQAHNVEVYNCTVCNQMTRFPRYNHPEKLLETRGGRCGEWANCFCLFLRVLNFDARYIRDWTDHVWCEVYSKSQKRWLHADPCENALDKPLLYEYGWNKKLTYVVAFSRHECVDVTWRYSCKHQEVLGRRNKCDENWLVYFLNKLSRKRQANLTKEVRDELQIRLAFEIVEFLSPKGPKEGEDIGRQSGSLQWRLSRGETQANRTEVKNLNKILIEPQDSRVFSFKYNTVRNLYLLGDKEIKEWQNMTYNYSNIKYKTEFDWKMCYLAREKGPDMGFIEWYFDLGVKSNLQKLDLVFKWNCFESGLMKLSLFGIKTDNSESTIDLKEDSGSGIFRVCFTESNFKAFKLRAELCNGTGDCAWQHTQLFRQSLNQTDQYLFNATFYFN